MKRNENLKTLSWEHHDGLVVSFRLQQGLNKNTDAIEMAEYILFTWGTVLEHHFWQEEQTISSNLSKSETATELMNQFTNEHEQIRYLVNQIKQDNTNTKYIKEFADVLNKHIRFEERQLFPLFEKEMGKARLAEIGKFLKKHHNDSCEVWQNQFWKD